MCCAGEGAKLGVCSEEERMKVGACYAEEEAHKKGVMYET